LLGPNADCNTMRGVLNGCEWVDLGLSVKWATCNIGALKPEENGYYVAWGEISEKASYTENNSISYRKLWKDIAGNSLLDIANHMLGPQWRIPTGNECDELVKYCSWEKFSINGHNGSLVTGPSGSSIFLPAAGWKRDGSLFQINEEGHYWSSTPALTDEDHLFAEFISFDLNLIFNNKVNAMSFMQRRYEGYSVRPVLR